jgi:hypothetical protein
MGVFAFRRVAARREPSTGHVLSNRLSTRPLEGSGEGGGGDGEKRGGERNRHDRRSEVVVFAQEFPARTASKKIPCECNPPTINRRFSLPEFSSLSLSLSLSLSFRDERETGKRGASILSGPTRGESPLNYDESYRANK